MGFVSAEIRERAPYFGASDAPIFSTRGSPTNRAFTRPFPDAGPTDAVVVGLMWRDASVKCVVHA
ncbi:MAG: hypothetical protein DME77_09120 [Verrucomicrobia bacterium]|nr:MAG: hypothetical protein DME77_09120 [Verrucomicrobiota bacterium]